MTTTWRSLLGAARGSFRVVLTVLLETGARPGELCVARIEHVKDGAIVLPEHKTDEDGEDRIIYLSTAARALVEQSVAGRSEGPIFLNSRKQPWTPDTLYCRFKRLRKKLGLGDGVFPYATRHTFASAAINKSNMNAALVARQLGHKGMEVLLKHYLRENPEAMREALDLTRKREGHASEEGP